MLFNSLEFFIFLLVVFSGYFLLNRKKYQNGWLLAASYFFYGWWDWRFLSLIFISTFLDYVFALALAREEKENSRKMWLVFSIWANLGLLGFFKYFNFFTQSFCDMLAFFHLSVNSPSLHIILPIGISFYTFQTMSYSIDVYRRKLTPTKNFLDFALYVSFFPQLVAGPIEIEITRDGPCF